MFELRISFYSVFFRLSSPGKKEKVYLWLPINHPVNTFWISGKSGQGQWLKRDFLWISEPVGLITNSIPPQSLIAFRG